MPRKHGHQRSGKGQSADVDPTAIRFSSDTVYDEDKNGVFVMDDLATRRELLAFKDLQTLPCIRDEFGTLWAVDNRLLWLYRELAANRDVRLIPCWIRSINEAKPKFIARKNKMRGSGINARLIARRAEAESRKHKQRRRKRAGEAERQALAAETQSIARATYRRKMCVRLFGFTFCLPLLILTATFLIVTLCDIFLNHQGAQFAPVLQVECAMPSFHVAELSNSRCADACQCDATRLCLRSGYCAPARTLRGWNKAIPGWLGVIS